MREGKDLYSRCEDKSVCKWQPDTPYHYVFQRGLDDGAFWNREFERKATLILSGARSQTQMGEIHAPIKGHLDPTPKRIARPPSAAPSSAAYAEQKGNKGNRSRPYPEQKCHAVTDGVFTHNRGQSKLCQAFQTGNCSEGRGGWCPVNWGERHQCNKCLADSHGGAVCTLSPRPPSAKVQAPPGGRKGGKGGRKGKSKRAGQG